MDHPSQARPGIHVLPDRLHVVTMLENPLRWRSRYWNYWMFERECEAAGAILYNAAEAKYVAWIDADVKFNRPDWAQETMQLLQHYDVLQMFSHAQDVGPDYEP